MTQTPDIRLRRLNQAPIHTDGDFVLYWMVAFRRPFFNFSLDRAVEWAQKLKKPLLILEPLRCDYRWANDRLHAFVLQGMADNQKAFSKAAVTYYPYVEPQKGAGKGLLEFLSEKACTVVTDDYPGFFLPRMLKAASDKLKVCVEAVDSNGLLPLRATEQVYPTAYAFRRFLQKSLRPHLEQVPAANAWANVSLPLLEHLPKALLSRWPRASDALLSGNASELAALPLDHSVAPVTSFVGGHSAAKERLQLFIKRKLRNYPEKRSEPEEDGSSKLSPHLHFGHMSTHEILAEMADHEGWNPSQVTKQTSGQRNGYWGLPEFAEAFIDELITWRELGFNMASKREDCTEFTSLPPWAQQTLAEHAQDPRPNLYSPQQLEAADTHDVLWNAAMMQLKTEGWFHNYLRMLWGKKILEYTKSPQQALQVMEDLMNKYSLDGRGPNAYSGFFWVLGRYDRPWGPERKIFGKIRYMSSENTARKFSVENYIAQYAPKGRKQGNLF